MRISGGLAGCLEDSGGLEVLARLGVLTPAEEGRNCIYSPGLGRVSG